MSEASKTPDEVPIQVLINGNGRFAGEIEEMIAARNQEIRTAAVALFKEKTTLETQLAAARADSERLLPFLQHHLSCEIGLQGCVCSCGLAKALSAHKALNQKENEL